MSGFDDDDLDFYEQLGQDAYVEPDPPIGANFEFEDDFDRRASELNRKPYKNVQKVSQLELRQGPWSGNNQLGNEVAFAPDLNNEQTVFKMDEWGMPTVWSVMLGVTHDDFEVNTTLGITAKIFAGVGGTSQEFEVDWLAGTTFSVNANALNVVARYTASSFLGDDIRLRVTVGRGSKLTHFRPCKTIQVSSLVAGGGTVVSTDIRIPPFTRSFTIISRSETAARIADLYSANFTAVLKTSPIGGAVGAVQGSQILSFGSEGFPISQFQRYMHLELTNPAVAVSPTVIFFLGL